MTTRERAEAQALGYAWGREDSSGVRTAERPKPSGISGPLQFAVAYAQMHDDYSNDRRWTAFPVKDAYERWQETNGRTIYKDGESTEEQQRRSQEWRRKYRMEHCL